MKRILGVIFAIFMVLGCASLGGVFLTRDNHIKSSENESVQVSAIIPTRHYMHFYTNGGSAPEPRPYQIGNISLTNYGYGFNVNSNGYLESQNKGVASSYAMLKITFNALTAYGDSSPSFTIRYISNGENNFDYAIFSNLDSTLSKSNTADSTYYKRTYGETSPYERSVTYSNISNGYHSIYVKYRKDGSANVGNDTLQLMFESDYNNNNFSSDLWKYQFDGMMYGTLPTATRSGYLFDGWYTNHL